MFRDAFASTNIWLIMLHDHLHCLVFKEHSVALVMCSLAVDLHYVTRNRFGCQHFFCKNLLRFCEFFCVVLPSRAGTFLLKNFRFFIDNGVFSTYTKNEV